MATAEDESFSATEKDNSMLFGAVEAQWVLAVLDEASNKLNLASYLTPDILKDKVIDGVDEDMVLALKEHFDVEKQYMEVLAQVEQQKHLSAHRAALNNEDGKSADEPTESKEDEEGAEGDEGGEAEKEEGGEVRTSIEEQTEAILKELDVCLCDSTRTVSRLLKKNQLLTRRLREVADKRSARCLEFMNVFTRLRKLVLERLRMTAEEERYMLDQLEKYTQEEEEDNEKYMSLTEHLAADRTEHKQSLDAKDKKIQRLQKQIDSLTRRTAEERTTFKAKMAEEAEQAKLKFETEEKELSENLSASRGQLSEKGAENWTQEGQLHRKRYNESNEVQDLVDKFDKDMTLTHRKLTKLNDEYDDEKAEYKVLEEYFAEVDAEIKRQEEEIKDLTKRRNEELARERKKHQAAILVQKLYRGFYARAIAGGKKKPKKDDGKKKK